jgi:hypothetical protein
MSGAAFGNPVVPIPMHVHVSKTSTGFQACGVGQASASVNVWTLRVAGARSDGSAINATIVSFQPLFNDCISVTKNGTSAGQFSVTFTFAGTAPDIVGSFAGYGLWAPGQSDQTGDTGIG